MFVIPGLEGCVAVLEPLCRRLKTKVCGLQFGLEQNNDNIVAMTDALYEVR